MESVKLNYIHLCDAATVDSSGKINILGIFGRIFLSDVPSRFPKFTVVVSLKIGKVSSNKKRIQIKVLDSKSKELTISPPIQLELDLNQTELKNNADINLILDINNLEFQSYDEYTVNVYINESKIGSTLLSVEERKL